MWTFTAAIASLALAIAPAIVHSRRRAAFAKSDPQRLLDPPPDVWPIDIAAIALAFVAAGLGAPGALAPISTLIAAYALFVVGHRRTYDLAGTLGLLLVGIVVVRVMLEWLPLVGFNLLLGLTVAAWLLHWFAIFWHQQLHHGKAWTTAGRLAPRAEALSYVFLAGALLTYALIASAAPRPSWTGGFLALIMLAMCIGFGRRAGRPDARLGIRRAARVATYLLAIIATAPICVLLAGVFGWHVAPLWLAAWLGVGILLLALV